MRTRLLMVMMVVCFLGLLAVGCSPQKAEPVKAVQIADGTIDPAEWGKAYPIEYELWKKTALPSPSGHSKYKKGNDAPNGEMLDKLSEFPYLALLYNGWGFGIGYNEPRGHNNMIKDQLEIDGSRVKPGSVCLTCKSPYATTLAKTMGPDFYKTSFKDGLAKIPDQKNAQLGVSCSDCHSNKDMSLKIERDWTLGVALKDMGVDTNNLDHQKKRSLVCAQCHVTYIIPRDKDMKPTAVFFPWQGSKEGNISIENIIKKMKSDPAYGEWKQGVTGFKMPFIRHPEYELYSFNSVHWNAGVSCADCHMPYTKVGAHKVSDHTVMSPMKNGFKGCRQCHNESPEWLKNQILAIQDRTVSMQMRAGYANATVAKLFEMAHKAQAEGKTVDKVLYDKAKEFYEEGFYRLMYIGAENSVGFHNPTEAMRVLGDSVAFATKSEAFLRQGLTMVGVNVPVKVDLELAKYLNNRGEKKYNYKKEVEVADPSAVQTRF